MTTLSMKLLVLTVWPTRWHWWPFLIGQHLASKYLPHFLLRRRSPRLAISSVSHRASDCIQAVPSLPSSLLFLRRSPGGLCWASAFRLPFCCHHSHRSSLYWVRVRSVHVWEIHEQVSPTDSLCFTKPTCSLFLILMSNNHITHRIIHLNYFA